MLEKIPDTIELEKLVGKEKQLVFQKICKRIDSLYEMDTRWNTGGKKWVYEYKFARGGKTLCAFYFKPQVLAFMVILGKEQREIFEQDKSLYHPKVVQIYEQTPTYYDGKWLLLELEDVTYLEEIERLLKIKRKSNRKLGMK